MQPVLKKGSHRPEIPVHWPTEMSSPPPTPGPGLPAVSESPLIALALAEDLGERGDITAQCFVPANHRSLGRIVAREPLVVSGTTVAAAVFSQVDPSLETTIQLADGEPAETGQEVMTVSGPTRSLLTGERTALNFLQRLSGIATQARTFVEVATGPGGRPGVRILDTRKTTPGWRALEKAAVVHGGGINHRIGLYDAAMVKDNHLVAENDLEALAKGIETIRERFPGTAFVELEADRLDQVNSFLELPGVDTILLDNMTLEELRQAVALRETKAPDVTLEASGGVTLETIAGIAATGVDAISVGALTHSATAVDLALDLDSLPAS